MDKDIGERIQSEVDENVTQMRRNVVFGLVSEDVNRRNSLKLGGITVMNKFMQEFYIKHPTFDWKFYISCYSDLRTHDINTEYKAITHYHTHGCNENRRTHHIIQPNISICKLPIRHIISNVTQCAVSSGLDTLKSRFMRHFHFSNITSSEDPAVFFGVYTDLDLQSLLVHNGLKYIIWGGEDANPNNIHANVTINEVKNLHNIVHLSISKCIYNRLHDKGISSIHVDFNMVDKTIFYPIPKNELGKYIYIFNGQIRGREHIYGKLIYEDVMKRLPQYKYILSNHTNIEYADMPGIYKQCFIMLRLTSTDGNANSVQECESMGIPVVHNQSDYGLKWKNIDDIISHIYQCAV